MFKRHMSKEYKNKQPLQAIGRKVSKIFPKLKLCQGAGGNGRTNRCGSPWCFCPIHRSLGKPLWELPGIMKFSDEVKNDGFVS